MSGLTEFGECIYKLTEIKLQHDQLKEENEKLRKVNEQLKNKNTGLEHAIVQANKTIDFLSKKSFGSDGE